MTGRPYIQGMPKNPILQALSLLAFGVALIGAVLMGAIVLAFVIGFAAVFAVVFWIRLWWVGRKIRRHRARQGDGGAAAGNRVIEVEYSVVDERKARRRD